MNLYGQRAQTYFQQHLPQRYSEIPNPTDHFSALGEQISEQVDLMTDQLAGPDPAGEDYLTKVGRLRMAKLQATEAVMSDLVYSAIPETAEDDEDLDEPSPMELLRRKWARQDQEDLEAERRKQNLQTEQQVQHRQN